MNYENNETGLNEQETVNKYKLIKNHKVFIEKIFKIEFILINIIVITYLLYKIIFNQQTPIEEYLGIILLWMVGIIPSAFMNYIINYNKS